jgi:hypothetical protein
MSSTNVLYLWTNGDSTIPLAELLHLEGQLVGVVDIHGKIENGEESMKKPYYLCSDIANEAYVNSIKLPVLCQICTNTNGYINNTMNNVIWLRVRRETIDKLRLYICDEKGDIKSFEGKGVYCTLLFFTSRYDN